LRKESSTVIWLEEPQSHDCPAALSHPSLLFAPEAAARWVAELASADLTRFHAKDLFWASGLSLLGVRNTHVQRDLQKIRRGIGLPPLLLLRDHRLCAVYRFDEDAIIPCKICG